MEPLRFIEKEKCFKMDSLKKQMGLYLLLAAKLHASIMPKT
jgi:hypothetical protein